MRVTYRRSNSGSFSLQLQAESSDEQVILALIRERIDVEGICLGSWCTVMGSTVSGGLDFITLDTYQGRVRSRHSVAYRLGRWVRRLVSKFRV